MGETAQEVGPDALFSIEEKRTIIRSFIEAFLRGKAIVTIWAKPSVANNVFDLSTGRKMTLSTLASSKEGVLESISVVCGVGNPARDIVNRHIDALFGTLVALSSGGFIEGEFLEDP